MLKAFNIHYEFDSRQKGISYGGIGIIHLLAKKTGLIEEVDNNLELLKRHLPYHESDHVANLAYNVLAAGTCLQDIELRRNDDAWLDALGAEIIPDPTTAGDFLRRFKQKDVIELMETKNTIRQKIWQQQPKTFRQKAIINIGSVGQPRDKDNRASYVYVKDDQVNFVRLDYDYETTMKKILEIDQLDNFHAERLQNGR